jgi:hypothetical protein
VGVMVVECDFEVEKTGRVREISDIDRSIESANVNTSREDRAAR